MLRRYCAGFASGSGAFGMSMSGSETTMLLRNELLVVVKLGDLRE